MHAGFPSLYSLHWPDVTLVMKVIVTKLFGE